MPYCSAEKSQKADQDVLISLLFLFSSGNEGPVHSAIRGKPEFGKSCFAIRTSRSRPSGDRTGEDEAMPVPGAPANCRQLVRASAPQHRALPGATASAARQEQENHRNPSHMQRSAQLV